MYNNELAGSLVLVSKTEGDLMLKCIQITGCSFLLSSLAFAGTLPSVAQIPPANCSIFLARGRTLNWIAMVNGLPVNRGTLTILSVPQSGRWSGRQVNQTTGNTTIDLGGQFDGSTMTLVNGAYPETWRGTCNARGIGGQVNNDPNATFVMW
jgi:hypothetical protein